MAVVGNRFNANVASMSYIYLSSIHLAVAIAHIGDSVCSVVHLFGLLDISQNQLKLV